MYLKGNDMMKAGHSVSVLNPYEWLPGHGENAIKLSKEGRNLSVAIEYDGPHGVKTKTLRFTAVCSFSERLFPGAVLPGVQYDDKGSALLGMLVEYPNSEAALAWVECFRGQRVVKHYSIAFLSENIWITIFADGFTLID